MDYMNYNEQDLDNMFEELNKIVAKLSFETNQKKCDVIYNQYRELVQEIKDLIIGKVRDLDEARERAKKLVEYSENLIRLSNHINDEIVEFI